MDQTIYWDLYCCVSIQAIVQTPAVCVCTNALSLWVDNSNIMMWMFCLVVIFRLTAKKKEKKEEANIIEKHLTETQ